MKKKITAIFLCVALVAIAIVGASLAYFTDTDEKTNTFTVGNVDIVLTEPEWDENQAKLIPGRVIPKDPTITLENDSERAYTFMKVQLSQDFMELIQTYYGTGFDFVNGFNNVVADWFILPEGYAPKVMSSDLSDRSVILGVLSPKDPGDSVTYFKGVKVPADVEGEMIKENGSYEINITAYAIQAEGFEGTHEGDKNADRKAAYDALFPEQN